MFLEAFGEEVIGKFAGLFESINAFVNFRVYPSVVIVVREVVFGDEFLRDGVDLDTDVFGSVEQCAKIEVRDIIACKSCILCGEDAVELQFDKFERSSFGASVTRIADPVASNCDAGAVWVRLLWAYFTDDAGICYVVALHGRDVCVLNWLERVGSCNPFLHRVHSIVANAMTEATEFIGV